ncbi:MAG: hypothetical protein ACXVCV_03795, partial [Polyangia bacterium]
EPSALAAVRWTRDIGSAELRYSHDISANALFGGTFSSDQVALQASVPILRAKMLFGATAAYQHSRLLSATPGVADATAHLALLDVTVAWQPHPIVRLFARYSFFDQFGSPPVGDMPALLPDLTRNVVMVGVNILYPAVMTARLSSERSSRVDRSDQSEFPEMHAPQPQ